MATRNPGIGGSPDFIPITDPDAPDAPDAPDVPDSPGSAPAPGGIWADPEKLRQHAGVIEAATSKVETVVAYVETRTASYNGIWGNDEVGKGIEAMYPESRVALIGGLRYVDDLMRLIAEGLRMNADNYQRADEEAAAAVES